MTFKELNLGEEVLEAISYMGFEKATPIQEQASGGCYATSLLGTSRSKNTAGKTYFV